MPSAARWWAFPIVIGENVVGVDQANQSIKKGKISKAPELDRRIDTYLRYYDGYGAIIVQMNVEDTRNGVAEYVIDKYGDKCIIELKWGQGAKDIGGEIQVTQPRLRPLPQGPRLCGRSGSRPTRRCKKAFKNGAIKSFARHSRLGGTNLDTRRPGARGLHEDGGLPAQASVSSASR